MGCAGAGPPVSPHQSNQEGRGRAARPRASPTAQSLSFRPLCNGRNQSSRVPRAECPDAFSSFISLTALGGGHHYDPSVQVGKLRPREGQPPVCSHTPGQRRCWSTPAMPSRDQDTPPTPPRPLPTSPKTTGLEEEEQGSEGRRAGCGGGGHPQEAALFLELRFKETQDAKLSPQQLWLPRWQPLQPGPLREGWGRKVWAKGPAPHPGLEGPSQCGLY